jgi:hypothetical protein
LLYQLSYASAVDVPDSRNTRKKGTFLVYRESGKAFRVFLAIHRGETDLSTPVVENGSAFAVYAGPSAKYNHSRRAGSCLKARVHALPGEVAHDYG